jgi:hypothetical protein
MQGSLTLVLASMLMMLQQRTKLLPLVVVLPLALAGGGGSEDSSSSSSSSSRALQRIWSALAHPQMTAALWSVRQRTLNRAVCGTVWHILLVWLFQQQGLGGFCRVLIRQLPLSSALW